MVHENWIYALASKYEHRRNIVHRHLCNTPQSHFSHVDPTCFFPLKATTLPCFCGTVFIPLSSQLQILVPSNLYLSTISLSKLKNFCTAVLVNLASGCLISHEDVAFFLQIKLQQDIADEVSDVSRVFVDRRSCGQYICVHVPILVDIVYRCCDVLNSS